MKPLSSAEVEARYEAVASGFALRRTPLVVGGTMQVRGMTCTIRKVRPFGTVDVEAPNGNWYRVSGL